MCKGALHQGPFGTQRDSQAFPTMLPVTDPPQGHPVGGGGIIRKGG